jgi:hypothetical protein
MERIKPILPGLAASLAYGLALLGIDVIKLPFCVDHSALCAAAREYIGAIALLLTFMGVVAFIVRGVLWCWTAFQTRRDAIKYGKGEYSLEVAKIGELPELFCHYRDLFSTDLVPIEIFRSWVERYPDMVWKVMRSREGTNQMVGFFDIEPLTSSGRDKMRDRGANASELKPEDIWCSESRPQRGTRKLTRPSAFYIGSIGCPLGSSTWVRTATIAYLIKRLHYLAIDGTIEVFTRPTTNYGLELVKEAPAMTKCWADAPDMGSTWVCHFKRGQRLPAKIRKIAGRLRLADFGQ